MGMALILARDISSVQLATPVILKVTFSLIMVSFRVGVEIALTTAGGLTVDFAPFNCLEYYTDINGIEYYIY